MTLTCPVRLRCFAPGGPATALPVQHLVLDMPPDFTFGAGQYLEIVHRDGVIPLSIASGTRRLPALHLHYRSTPGVAEAVWMDALLAKDEPLQVRGPFGAVLPPANPAVPLLLVAAGTGITQVCAILDDLDQQIVRAPVTVLWCVDSPDDLYYRTELDRMNRDWLTIEYHVAPCPGDTAAGLQRIDALARANLNAAAASWVLLGGSPGFVHAASDVFVAVGFDMNSLHSDVFAWAPRAS